MIPASAAQRGGAKSAQYAAIQAVRPISKPNLLRDDAHLSSSVIIVSALLAVFVLGLILIARGLM
jgi:hypothetical protein